MPSYEELHEAFVALQRENEKLQQEADHAGFLLNSLGSLLRIDIDDDPFINVFDAMQEVLPHCQAMVLAEDDDAALDCIVAKPATLVGLRFRPGPFLAKIVDGKVSATFSNEGLKEWADIPAALISSRQPALYMPIGIRHRRGVLVLLRNEGAPGFSRGHVALAQQFSLLASHALAAVQSREMIEQSVVRAELAEEANRSKNLFIANMSHELRTPLNAIIGFSDLVMSEALGPLGVPRYREYLRDIRASGNHLLAVVNNLLLFAKIEAGQHRFDVEPLVLGAEIGYVRRLLQFDADNRRVDIRCDQDLTGLCAMADQQSLRQILLNVIGNAVKFSAKGAQVDIACTSTEDRFAIVVADSGCGIPSETLAEIGNPFVQAETAYSRTHGGTGLGLAICFALAEAMGANIEIESTVGQGTRVTVSVPAAGAERCAAE